MGNCWFFVHKENIRQSYRANLWHLIYRADIQKYIHPRIYMTVLPHVKQVVARWWESTVHIYVQSVRSKKTSFFIQNQWRVRFSQREQTTDQNPSGVFFFACLPWRNIYVSAWQPTLGQVTWLNPLNPAWWLSKHFVHWNAINNEDFPKWTNAS